MMENVHLRWNDLFDKELNEHFNKHLKVIDEFVKITNETNDCFYAEVNMDIEKIINENDEREKLSN